jgi:hypothetical protein
MWGKNGCCGPGSGAIDELCGLNYVSRSVDFDDVVGDGSDEADGHVGAEIDGGCVDGGEECGGEFAGIEAMFVQKSEGLVAWVELGQQAREFFWGEEVGLGGRIYGLEGDVGVEGDLVARKGLEAVEEGWVEGEAEIGEGAKLRRIVRIASGEHAGSGGGGFGEGGAAIENGDAGSAVVEFEGEGEADDAGSGDADVGALH